MDFFSKTSAPSKNTKYRQKYLIRNYSEPSDLSNIGKTSREGDKRNRKIATWRNESVNGDFKCASISTDFLNSAASNSKATDSRGLIAKRIRAKVSKPQQNGVKPQRLRWAIIWLNLTPIFESFRKTIFVWWL